MIILLAQSAILLFSILVIVIRGKGNFADFGFRIPKNLYFWRIAPLSLMYGVIATSIITWVGGDGNPLAADLSRIEIILLVWIYASISEEILFRGVLQTIIARKTKRVVRVLNMSISISVFATAIVFALDHIGSMLLTGASTAGIIVIVLFTFTVGITAGHYREKTGSLLPAIIIHMFSNIGGALPVIMLNVID